MKQNPICQECGLGWCDTVYINGIEYLKCRSCSHMRLVTKRTIIPVASPEEAEKELL